MLARIETISILFMSILLEAFPYLLLGALISSIIERFVPNSFFSRIIPKNPILGSIVGVIMGFFLPCCDCAVIPVAKGLIKKGVPQNVATSFMLASPIINPVVLLATYNAFALTNKSMIGYRVGVGVLVAIGAGMLVNIFTKGISFKDVKGQVADHDDSCGCGHNHHHHDEEEDACGCGHAHHDDANASFMMKMLDVMRHTAIEFFDVGKFLIIGALIAASVQILVPFKAFSILSNYTVLSIVLMGIFSYLMSLCSTSDAFVAKSFVGAISNASMLSFLVISPMLSVKNTIVLSGNFSKKYIVLLNLTVFILTCIACVVVSTLGF